jgi:hypothetical protein
MTAPTLGELREAIATTIGTAIPVLSTYPKIPDTVNLPAVVVVPTVATFGFSKADPDDLWPFHLQVLVSKADIGIGQDSLDAFISSGGPSSIREAVMRISNLGIEGAGPSVRAHVTDMSNYGGTFEAAGVAHIGATLGLLVTIRGQGG